MAIKAGVDIIPISISGSREVLPRGSLRVNPGIVRIVIGNPIPSLGYSLDTKIALMRTGHFPMMDQGIIQIFISQWDYLVSTGHMFGFIVLQALIPSK